MKTIVRLIALACFACAVPLVTTSCQTPPNERVATAQTLRAVGITAKAALDSATLLLKDGKITVAQYQKVSTFYDTQFQQAFRFALVAAQSDLAIASPDVVALGLQFAALVSQLTAN